MITPQRTADEIFDMYGTINRLFVISPNWEFVALSFGNFLTFIRVKIPNILNEITPNWEFCLFKLSIRSFVVTNG